MDSAIQCCYVGGLLFARHNPILGCYDLPPSIALQPSIRPRQAAQILLAVLAFPYAAFVLIGHEARLVKWLEPSTLERGGINLNKSKYDPLRTWLCRQKMSRVHLTFSEVETILGFGLPESARNRQQWWSNETGSATHHVQCRAWIRNGWNAS